MDQTVIVDDTLNGGVLQPRNFYHIEEFKGNPKDRRLFHLAAFLKHIAAQWSVGCVKEERRAFEEVQIPVEDIRSIKSRMRDSSHVRQPSDMGLTKEECSDMDEESTQSSLSQSEKESQ